MIYFLYITFWESLWNYNIKLLTYIFLAFAIPFSGYGQIDEDPLPRGCYNKTIFYLGLSGGTNFSKVNYNELASDYLASYQLGIEFQSLISSSVKESVSMLLYGLSYESKKYNIQNTNNKSILLESSYLTIPIKYQYNIIDLEESLPLSILFGGFYSFKLDENSINKDIEYLPNGNYGLIVGSKIELILNGGFFLNLDYNLQYGFASLLNTVSNSGNISHQLIIGFKYPSTIF